MRTRTAFTALVGAVAVERLAELVVSQRNARWSFDRGGVETGREHYPAMVALHAGLLVAAPLEVWLRRRRFRPGLGGPALAVVAGSQALRWWCIASLGRQWNTRVIVVPGETLVSRGPYRWLRHPNYVAVVAEGAALPLVHTAWVSSLAFSVLNTFVLSARLRSENAALSQLGQAPVPVAPADA